MQAVWFYLLYPVIYLIASLPFRALYVFSDVVYFLIRISGYRRETRFPVNLNRIFSDFAMTTTVTCVI